MDINKFIFCRQDNVWNVFLHILVNNQFYMAKLFVCWNSVLFVKWECCWQKSVDEVVFKFSVHINYRCSIKLKKQVINILLLSKNIALFPWIAVNCEYKK